MGHGILSGCPFHLTRSWTNDMTLSYSELHRWERQSTRKGKRKRKASSVSTKKKSSKTSSPAEGKKVSTTSGGRKPGIELAQLQKAKFIMSSTYRQVNGNLDTAKVGTWVFSTAYGTGFFESLTKDKGAIRFRSFKKVFSLNALRKALDCGALYFVEKIDIKKQREGLAHSLSIERMKIFQQVNFVDPSCFKPGRLRMGQEVINQDLNVGNVCFRSVSYVKVRYGRKEIRYSFPEAFVTGKLRLWGGYHGIGYSEKGQRMIQQRKQELQRLIDRFNEKKNFLDRKGK